MESCFNAGDITGAVIGTFVATLILMGIIWLVYTKMKKRKAKKSGMMDLVIVEEGRGDKDADKPSIYDNPGFVDDSMDPKKSGQQSGNDVKMNGSKKPMSSEDGGKKVPWGPFRFLFKSRSALDDSVMEEPQKYSVALRGHDFTGLGFNICGNMKDGIYVKDVMQRGPAAESKHILPGDQITSMTVSFQQMVLEDAVTLLSYASPYEVSLEMMRHPEKSLHHKGLYVSQATHPSSSGQSGTLERVCHPFFKSQSIDDLRKVGKEHLDQQVSRSKKQTNGMKLPSSSTTMEVPTVVVGSNEARSQKSSSQSPNANLSLGPGKLGLKAHHPKQMSVDEVDSLDSPRGPIFPEIKVSAKMSKPEIIPRAKSKVTNVKKDAPSDAGVAPPAASVVVVEAISPVVKMSADFEKMVEEHSISQQTNSADFSIKGPKSAAVIDVEQMEVVMPELQAPNMQDKIPSMMMMSGESSDTRRPEVKGPHVEIEMTGPELVVGMQDESSVKKPQRGQKGKDKADKNKEKESKKEKPSKEMKGDGEQQQQSPEKSKFGKFGFNLPDISLNFGKGNKSEEKEKEIIKEVVEVDEVVVVEMKKEESKQKPDKEKKDKSSKSKDKEKKEMSSSLSKSKKEDANENEPVTTTTFTSESSSSYHHEEVVGEKKPLEKSSSSGFGFHLKFPSFDKPILKRKDSSGSNSGEKEGEMMVDKDPGAKPESPSKPAKATKIKSTKESKTKEDKSRPTSPASRESDDSTENNEMMTMKPSTDPSDSADTEKSSSPKKGGGGFHMPHLGIKLPKFGHSKQTYSFENAGDGSAKESKQSEIPKNIEESSSTSVKVELTADAPDFSKSAKSVDDAAMKIKSSEMPISKSKKAPSASSSIVTSSTEVEAVSLPSMEARPSSPIGVSYGLYPPSVESEIRDKEAMSLGRSRSPTPLGDRGTKDKTMKSEEDLTEKDGKGEKSGESKPGLVSKVLRDLKEKVSGKRSHDGQHQQQHSAAQNNGSSSEDEADSEEQGKEVKATKEKAKLDKKAAKEVKEKAAAEAKKEKERLKAEKKVKKAELKAKKQAATSGQSSDSSSSSSDESDAQDKDKKPKKDKKKSKSAKLKDKEKKSGKSKPTSSSPPPVETIEIETETFEEVASMSQQQQTSDMHMEQMVKSGGDDKPPVAPRKSKESAMAKEKALTTEDSKSKKDKKPKKEKSEKKPKSKDKKGKKDDGSSTSSSSSSSDSEDESSGMGKPKKPKRSAKRKAPVPPTSTTTTITETVHETMTYAADAATSDVTVQLNESYSKTPESGRRSASFGDLSSLQPKLKMDNMDRTMSLDMAAENEQMGPTSSTMPVAGPVDDLSADPDPKVIIPHFTRSSSSQPPNLTTRLEETSSSSSSETLRAAAAAPTSVVHVHPKESSITVVTHTTNDNPPVSDDMPSGLTYGLTPTTTTIQQINVGSSDTSSTIQQQQQHGASEIQRMMDDTISMMNSIAHKMDSPSLVLSVPEREHQSGGVTFSTVQSQPAPATSSTMTISSSSSDRMTKDEAEMLAQQTVDDIIAHVNKNGGNQVHANGGGDDSMSSVGGIGARSMELSSNTVRNVTVTSIQQSMTAKDDQHHHMVEGDDSASSATNKASVLRGDSKSRLMQTVQDANTIKLNPISPLRKDSSMSSSSSSVDSSPEVRAESSPPTFLHDDHDVNKITDSRGTLTTSTHTPAGHSKGQTIEISSKELDSVMMSHAEFLQKQASSMGGNNGGGVTLNATTITTANVNVNMTPDSLEPASFDNWVYVEQKNVPTELTLCAHSHSDPEPSTSSSNDDDDMPYNRNGALSPSAYKMETEYKYATSEMMVTSSPIPSGEHSPTTTTVYSTTMTLPQKTVTQITLGEPTVDSHGRIVSKITLESSPTSADTTNEESDLPTLKSTK